MKGKCICKDGYKGSHCGVPKVVWASITNESYKDIRLRKRPRRIVMGIVVNHELELTEVRVRSLYHLVDIFVISEFDMSTGKL